MITDEIRKRLFDMADESYKQFHAKLIPNIPPEKIIGVRTPDVKKLAKEYSKHKDIDLFLHGLPHKYYDENNLHGFIVASCKDYGKTVEYLNEFLPYVDNWATCDLLKPKAFEKNHERLKKDIDIWLSSDKVYTKRFAMGMIMCHFLDSDFDESYLLRIADIKSDEYYVKMMQAWFFATALAKQWDFAVKIIEERRLDGWTHKKAIQKARESLRITKDQKEYLKGLK
ncbi:MAG: DNA alkylation repair protein [Oscillospiraceae bacterium]|nr:DNA alkylation repair protein [Oscillospiraceae bacterium]